MAPKLSKKKPEIDSLTLALALVGILIIIVGLYLIPIGTGRDVYVQYTVEKPLVGAVKFSAMTVVVHPHSAFASPMAGASWIPGYDLVMGGIKAVAMSGDVTIDANAGGVNSSKNIGQLIRLTSSSGTVILSDVSIDTKEMFVTVKEGDTVTESQKVVLP